MKINRNNEGKRIRVTFILLGIICLFLLLFTSASNYLKMQLEHFFLPIQASFYQSKENISDNFEIYLNRDQLFKENGR